MKFGLRGCICRFMGCVEKEGGEGVTGGLAFGDG
jgi:hypothetical protein